MSPREFANWMHTAYGTDELTDDWVRSMENSDEYRDIASNVLYQYEQAQGKKPVPPAPPLPRFAVSKIGVSPLGKAMERRITSIETCATTGKPQLVIWSRNDEVKDVMPIIEAADGVQAHGIAEDLGLMPDFPLKTTRGN